MSTTRSEGIRAGWGAAEITPQRATALYGQYYQRVSRGVRDPLGVTALALSQDGPGGASGQAILVSCDQVGIVHGVVELVRARLRERIPDFDASRLVVSATHTHNAPTSEDSLQWWTSGPSVLSPEEFKPVLVEAIAAAAARAWKGRAPSEVGWTAGFASVGHCRRTTYRDGSAQMYGSTSRPDFAGMEGGEDDTVGVVGVWSRAGKLAGLVVNVACPSQVMEATYVVTADMFGEMRRRLRERFGQDLMVLCQVGAAGDQAPRDLTRPYRGGPTYWDEEGMVELGGRLADAVAGSLPRAQSARTAGPVLGHEVLAARLPIRTVSPREYARAAAELAALQAREPADPASPVSAYSRFLAGTLERERHGLPGPFDDKNDDFVLMRNLEAVVRRFRERQGDPYQVAEIHVLRLGGLALATSPFELYQAYGLRIRARSPAALTLHAQLSCDVLGYLPTARAVSAGGYGALVANGLIGPEGGDLLVELVLASLERLFAA